MTWQEIIISIGVGVFGYLLRHAVGERRWERIRALAFRIIKDPDDPTTDPTTAVKKAIDVEFRDRLTQESQRLRRITDGHTPPYGVRVGTRIDDRKDD